MVDKAKIILVLFYICTGGVWFLIILFQFDWKIYPYLSSLYYTFSLLWIPLFYHFIFYITSTAEDKDFNYIHYIVPLIFFVILLIYPFFRPMNISFQGVNNDIVIVPIHRKTSLWVYLLAVFRRLFMLTYGVLIFLRIKRLGFDADKWFYSHNWLWVIMRIYIVIFIVTFLRLFDYSAAWPVILLTVAMAISLVLLQSVIGFNMIRGNYKFIGVNTAEEPVDGKRKYTNFQKSRYKSYNNKKLRVSITIDRSEFENYFRLKKPYLNSKLKIDDLVDRFNACKNVISSYVNNTYGMSFSWYVNHWRLKEMDRLMTLKSNKGKDVKDLVLKAGFGSYRSYMRAKAYFQDKNVSR